MQRISLVDETFDINFTLEYKLSIQLALDGFSFSILDSIQNKVIYLYHQELFETEPDFLLKRLKQIYEESEILERPFKKTRIIYAVPNRTVFVPEKLFALDHAESYIKLAFQQSTAPRILNNRIGEINYRAVYEIPGLIHDYFKEHHPGAEFLNSASFYNSDTGEKESLLYITIFKKHIVVSFVKEKELLFHNCFFQDGENDMLYFVLGSIKMSGLEPDRIILNGIVNKHETIYHRLRQYFTHVEIAKNPHTIHYSYLVEKLPDARFTNLFNSFQ